MTELPTGQLLYNVVAYIATLCVAMFAGNAIVNALHQRADENDEIIDAVEEGDLS